jgi:ligand-binding SRPBCC domain-containing protein
VAPHPVRNQAWTEALAAALKVWVGPPAPRIALQVVLGEVAQVILASQQVQPAVLKKIGFSFQFEHLDQALGDLFSWKKVGSERLLERSQWVPAPVDQVFDFFSSEKNLEILTPEFLHFKVLKKSTDSIQKGTQIEYRLRLHGVPIHWLTEITHWEPQKQFTDFQLKGPYHKWDHTHTFEPLAGGTWMKDAVVYQLPLTSFGGNLALPWVRRDVESIFQYRKKKIQELFGSKERL